MKKLILAVLALTLAVSAQAGEPVFNVAAGANAVWFDDPNGLPSDIEGGGALSASLSPHISLVGSAWFGFDNSYARALGGVRITATDVANPDFSIGLGSQYQVSSEPSIRPEEWVADVSIGWRPWPEQAPRVIVGAQGQYGMESNQASMLVGVRYALGGGQ